MVDDNDNTTESGSTRRSGADRRDRPRPGGERRRGARLRRRLSYAVAIVATLIITFVVFTKSRFLPNRVSTYINEHYLEGTAFEFRCGRISGDFVNRIVIHNPVLRYHSEEASFNVFRASEIAIDYRILDVLRFNLVVDNLHMRDVSLQIRRDVDGELVLPIPVSDDVAAGGTGGDFSGSIDVQRFEIDGLQVLFGDGERELKVRDVNLAGSFDLDGGVGRLEIDRGSAYLINTETSVSSFRLDVEHEGGDVRLNDLVVRLDRSFVMATGGYGDGVLRRLQFVFNPLSLDEVHLLGLTPELSGSFGGNIIFDGPLDSLSISGAVTGAGVGIAVGALSFEGSVNSEEIVLTHAAGDFFGSPVDGTFHYQLRGDQDWVFDGRCLNFDLTQGLLPDQGIPPTDFSGKVRVEFFAAAESFIFDAELDSARVDTYRTHETAIRGAWTPVSGLQLDEWSMSRPGYHATVSGTMAPSEETDMLFRVTGDDLSYFWDFAGIPRIEGAVSLSGRVVGPIDDLRINLNGDVHDAAFIFAAVDSGYVQADLRGIRSAFPQASVDLTGKRFMLQGRQFESPHLRLDVADGIAHVRDVTFLRGDTTFTTDFDVTALTPDSLKIDVHHAAIVHPGDAWRLTRPTTMYYTPLELTVDSLELTSVGGRVGLAGDYSEVRGDVDMSGWGENVDLAIIADATGLPIDITGTGAFRIDVRGDVDDPRVTLDVSLAPGRIDSLSFDRLEVAALYDRGEYRLRRLYVVEAGDSVSLTGWWHSGVSPVAMMRGGVDWQAALESPFEATLTGYGYTVTSLTRALHRRLPLGGAIDGTVKLTGTPASPNVDVAVTVRPRPGERFALPDTRLDGRYQDGTFRITRMELRGGVDADIDGAVPMEISFASGLRVLRDVPIALDVRIRQPEGPVKLGRYWSRVNVWTGGFSGDASVRGTIEKPQLRGELVMNQAEIQVAGMVERFRDVTGKVSLVDNVAQLTSLSARSDGGGSLRASGSVTLDGWAPSAYRIDVFLNDLWLRSIPNVESRQDGKLTVASMMWRDGRRIPNITGAVTVKEASLRGMFENRDGPPSPVTLPTVAPEWVCSIDLNGENNVWVRDPDLRIELGGQLILKRDEQGLYLRGDLDVLRGQYTVYGNKFRIIDGTLDFSTASLRPEVHINAYTPHRIEGGFERRIYLNLDWPRDKKEPQLALTYDEPGYYESDIWRMLGGSVAEGLAANTLERVLNEQMSDVTIEVEQRQTRASEQGTAEQEMMIGVGKYLWEDVYLRYRQGLTLETSREVEVEYRLSNMFLIRSELIRHARRSYVGANRQSLDEFNLDIRLRWEF